MNINGFSKFSTIFLIFLCVLIFYRKIVLLQARPYHVFNTVALESV